MAETEKKENEQMPQCPANCQAAHSISWVAKHLSINEGQVVRLIEKGLPYGRVSKGLNGIRITHRAVDNYLFTGFNSPPIYGKNGDILGHVPFLPHRRKGFVYLIQLGEFHKIGRAAVLKQRFSSYKSLPFGFRELWTASVCDMDFIENYLVRCFMPNNVKGREWFKLTDYQVNWLCGFDTESIELLCYGMAKGNQ